MFSPSSLSYPNTPTISQLLTPPCHAPNKANQPRYHTLNNHSHKTASFWIELDYLGIVVLMWGSMVATIYHGLICDAKLQRVYWSMVFLPFTFASIASPYLSFPFFPLFVLSNLLLSSSHLHFLTLQNSLTPHRSPSSPSSSSSSHSFLPFAPPPSASTAP